MKKTSTALIAATTIFANASAHAQSLSLDDIPLISNKPVRLNDREREGVKVTRRMIETPALPVPTGNGGITFRYGDSMASIVCAVQRVCDIALQPGERVKDVLIGDSARWEIAPAESGGADQVTEHVVIKPLDVGLSTNMMVTTDRRVYHWNLKSARNDHMPSVQFSYPEDQQRAWAAFINRKAQVEQAQAARVVDGLGLSVDDLNFKYKIKGDAPWRPSRVFDDGIKTYIEMPPSVSSGDAPVLFIRNDDTHAITNYRLVDNRYVIDGLVEHVDLVRGVGRKAKTITIRRAS